MVIHQAILSFIHFSQAISLVCHEIGAPQIAGLWYRRVNTLAEHLSGSLEQVNGLSTGAEQLVQNALHTL